MITIEQLYEMVQTQQEEITCLNKELKALKEWSDLNDYWLREMIDALTESVDANMDKIAANKCNINKNKSYIEENKHSIESLKK